MDPVANMDEQRKLAREIAETIDAVVTPSGAMSLGGSLELANMANRLAELVTALDEWRTNGGFDPYAPLREKFRDDSAWEEAHRRDTEGR